MTAPILSATLRRLAIVTLSGLVPTLLPCVRAEDGLAKLFGPKPVLEKVAGDCRFTEGPAWSPDGYLLFSDIPNSRILRIGPDGKLSEFLKPSGRANGLAFDAQGRLYACQGGERRLSRIDPKTLEITVLASEFEGKKLNSPNDLALAADGGVWFTDPRYRKPLEDDPGYEAVYWVSKKGEVKRVIKEDWRPNGILLSTDEKSLYVAAISQRQILRYPVLGPGELGEAELLYTGDEQVDGRGPDGMALDADGNIYATYKKLVVVDPKGQLLGRIEVPEKPANCTFGGRDGSELFVTARTSLYRIATRTKGARHLSQRLVRVPAGDITLSVPATWKVSQPTSTMRKAQLDVPAAGDDKEAGEYVVYFFGRGQGGGVDANLERWIGQFQPEGRTYKTSKGESRSGPYHLLEVTGTYNKPIGPPRRGQSKAVPGQRMLAAILATPAGSYFIKFTGPDKTVSGATDSFRQSFGADIREEVRIESSDRL